MLIMLSTFFSLIIYSFLLLCFPLFIFSVLTFYIWNYCTKGTDLNNINITNYIWTPGSFFCIKHSINTNTYGNITSALIIASLIINLITLIELQATSLLDQISSVASTVAPVIAFILPIILTIYFFLFFGKKISRLYQSTTDLKKELNKSKDIIKELRFNEDTYITRIIALESINSSYCEPINNFSGTTQK